MHQEASQTEPQIPTSSRISRLLERPGETLTSSSDHQSSKGREFPFLLLPKVSHPALQCKRNYKRFILYCRLIFTPNFTPIWFPTQRAQEDGIPVAGAASKTSPEPEESAHVATPAQAAPERSEMDCAVTCASHSQVPPSRARVLLCIMPGLGISSTSEITGNAHSSPLQGMPGPALFNLLL